MTILVLISTPFQNYDLEGTPHHSITRNYSLRYRLYKPKITLVSFKDYILIQPAHNDSHVSIKTNTINNLISLVSLLASYELVKSTQRKPKEIVINIYKQG